MNSESEPISTDESSASNKENRVNSGGAAASGGFTFQERVGAYLAVQMLAESHSVFAEDWSLPVETRLTKISFETQNVVDDIVCETSNGGHLFIQAKCSLGLDDAFEKAGAQLVEQFLATPGSQAAGLRRKLDKNRDRLCLVTNSEATAPIKVHLASILQRIEPAPANVSEVALSEREKDTLKRVLLKLKNKWKPEPGDQDVVLFLQFLRVSILDLELGQTDARTALTQLRNSVLAEPDQALSCWDTLCTFCHTCTTNHECFDHTRLQSHLLKQGFKLKAKPSYQKDIDRLVKESEGIRRRLSSYSKLENAGAFSIARDCHQTIRQRAQEGNLLVTGDPGAGKSGALYQFVEAELANGKDVVVLSVERIGARSLSVLRSELGLEHDFATILENIPGVEPAYLVLDGLDAARDGSILQMLEDLIDEVGRIERWRVVATIRCYELRYSSLARWFSRRGENEPSEHFNKDCKECRHVYVSALTPNELAQLRVAAPNLHELVSGAGPELRKLLETPFNLNLAAELIQAGSSALEISVLSSQVSLFDRFWKKRVLSDLDVADDRETLLRETCRLMLASRSLRVFRSGLQGQIFSKALKDLLSINLLCEWSESGGPPDREQIAFSHNLLFDYVVARLVLRSKGLTSILKAQKDFIFLARPSLELHFAYLWELNDDRRQFWQAVFSVAAEPDIPEITKLVGPFIAAKLAKSIEDLAPLMQALSAPAALMALKHLVVSVRELPAEAQTGKSAGPWSQLVRQLSISLELKTEWPARVLLFSIYDCSCESTLDQKKDLALAAQKFLEFYWLEDSSSYILNKIIRIVVATYDSAPDSAEELVRRIFSYDQLAKRGRIQLTALAEEFEKLSSSSPLMAMQLLTVAFVFDGKFESQFQQVDTSNGSAGPDPRQDFKFAQWLLTEGFPVFLRRYPALAILALDQIMLERFERGHFTAPETFEFLGFTASLQSDYSRVSVFNSRGEDLPIELLQHFGRYLREEESVEKVFPALLPTFAEHCKSAALWREVLLFGAVHPQTFGRLVQPLLLVRPILTSDDTRRAAGHLMQALSPFLDKTELAEIESAILGLRAENEASLHHQARLLSRLGDGRLSSEQSVKLVAEYRLAEQEFEQRRKVDIVRVVNPGEHPSNARAALDSSHVLALTQEVAAFVKLQGDGAPLEPDALEEILPKLTTLRNQLEKENSVSPDAELNRGWGYLAWACERIVSANAASGSRLFICETLLCCSDWDDPTLKSHSAGLYWDPACAPISAAQGLMILVSQSEGRNAVVLESIRRLSKDPAPMVRYQIFERLQCLQLVAPELMWTLAEECGTREETEHVIVGLVRGLKGILHLDWDRGVNVILELRKRSLELNREIRADYIWLLLRAHFEANQAATDCVVSIAENPNSDWSETKLIANSLRSQMSCALEPDISGLKKLGTAAFDLMDRLLSSTSRLEAHAVSTKTAENKRETLKACFKVYEAAATQLYFASGANYAKAGRSTHSPDELDCFYRLARKTLEILSRVAYPPVAGDLLQVLESFIDVDPIDVFAMAARSTLASVPHGLMSELQAEEYLLRIVNRYLADYRELFQQNGECRDLLISILDVFVGCGSREAVRLVYQLDIFR